MYGLKQAAMLGRNKIIDVLKGQPLIRGEGLTRTNPLSPVQSVVFKCSFNCGVKIEVALRELEMFVLYHRFML